MASKIFLRPLGPTAQFSIRLRDKPLTMRAGGLKFWAESVVYLVIPPTETP